MVKDVQLFLRLLRYKARRVGTRILDELPHRLPRKWVNHLTAANMGRLSVEDPRLHTKEVPTMTVEDMMNAMKYDERSVR